MRRKSRTTHHLDKQIDRRSATPIRTNRKRLAQLIIPALAIAAIGTTVTAAWGWSAGWIGTRVTATRFVDVMEQTNGKVYTGFRRAHSKGICVTGRFQPAAGAASLSKARVFHQANVPVLGRLSIAGADPHAPDATQRVRSMALLLRTDDGQQWRTAMNSFPFFPVSTPQGFYDQRLATAPDPATGKPDPEKLHVFFAAHPEARNYDAWATTAPWPNSWANTQFNGVDAFRFVNDIGARTNVRWAMRPQEPFVAMSAQQRAGADNEYLSEDFERRVALGPVRWDLVVTIAAPGDPIDDPSRPWPAGRVQIVAGTLELDKMTPQATGPCRDVNFDPLVLPNGIEPSDDPVLAARSTVYAQSYNRREREIARGQATDATGQEVPR
ncbi:catalase family peroxidase [Paraburkholderia sp. J7]|uniref:catalase family peroxidase n=1 Tax=Paraburkholderia sp. J7 TaxID=2805438 RepID=UPI002AB66C37|nr:catalase family peroxidase [Paraburkholderia sp. J7]